MTKKAIAGGIAGGFLILMTGIGIGAYPSEKRAVEYAEKNAAAKPNCPTEDSCTPEWINGKWYIIEGELPPKVCRGLDAAMIPDCIKLAAQPSTRTIYANGQESINPNGIALVRECREQYVGIELGECLKP